MTSNALAHPSWIVAMLGEYVLIRIVVLDILLFCLPRNLFLVVDGSLQSMLALQP